MKTILVKFDNTNNSAIEYIGYYNMLDTIVEQIKECSYEKRIEYIDVTLQSRDMSPAMVSVISFSQKSRVERNCL